MKTIACLLLCLSSLAFAQNHVSPKAQTTMIMLHPKPQAEDKNPDGSPAYKTYEDYVEALAGWKAYQVLASLAHTPAVTIKEQSGISSSEVDDLKKRIATLESKLSLDEFFLASKQDKQTAVSLDPASMNVYQRLDSNSLQFLVSLSSVVPYLNGYKAVIDIGNPSTARFKGVKIKCQWSKPYDWSKYSTDSYNAWKAAIHSSVTDVSNDISPGSWNPVEIILLPASQEELGYFEVSIESNTVSLSNN